MGQLQARFVGVELYFEDLAAAKNFYSKTLGLATAGEQTGHYAKFQAGEAFVCLERKGVESYPSKDKAVLFFQVPDLKQAITAIDPDQVVHSERSWAVLHDPEGHNILLLQQSA
jgi:predicted enzyme related to lactoylglutathione lyase